MNLLSLLLLQVAEHAPEAAEVAHDPCLAAEGGHEDTASILMHHVTNQAFCIGGHPIPGGKHMVFFVIAAVAVMAMVRLGLRSYKKGGIPTGLGAVVEILALYVRDEIAEKNIGHGDGRKFAPLLMSFFFFILIAAFIGLLPFSATSTGNLAVTAALATVSFFAMQWGGISKHGVVHHFGNLLPGGLPKMLIPIMIPVEIMGMFARPFALMIRLFANMLAGHMVITSLLMLIPLMAAISTAFGIAMIPVSVGLSLFILFLEVLVAFIQAYIFTLLTAIFIGMNAHPAH